MKKITTQLMKTICSESSTSPRKRKNHNLHRKEEPVQRFLNAMQPETYVQPHKHEGESKFEFFCALKGSFGILIFSEDGEITKMQKFGADDECRGLEIPGDTYHTIICLEKDSVILEIKEGPYNAAAAKYFLSGFPDEFLALRNGLDSGESEKISRTLDSWQAHFRA